MPDYTVTSEGVGSCLCFYFEIFGPKLRYRRGESLSSQTSDNTIGCMDNSSSDTETFGSRHIYGC